MDKNKSSATATRIQRVTRVEREERGRRRDPLYETLAALPIEERIATINRMAERMGV